MLYKKNFLSFSFVLCILLVMNCQRSHKSEKNDLVTFTNITKYAGVITSSTLGGHGAISGDVNGDGLVDLFYTNTVSHGQENLFINQGDGTFKEESIKRGADDPRDGSHGMVLVDIDCDGDFDIWNGATGGPNHVYLNDGNGYFTDITKETGIIEQWAATRGVTAGNINGDGLPDLIVVNPSWANEIYINRGGTHFTALGDPKDTAHNFGVNRDYSDLGLHEVGALLDFGIPEERDHTGLKQGVSLVDYDSDGDMDLVSSIWNYPLHLIRNDGNGNFNLLNNRKIFGANLYDFTSSTFCDLNNDGLLDCVLGGDSVAAVFKNKGDGTFQDMTQKSGLPPIPKTPSGHPYHIAAGDVDNDGLVDLYLARDYRPNVLYKNFGNFRFKIVKHAGACLDSVIAIKADCRSASLVDYDGDGDLDIWAAYKRHYGQLYRNDLQSVNHWLKVQLIGPKGDVGAFGTQVWIYKAGHLNDESHLIGYQQAQAAHGYMGQDDPVLHFGLGETDIVDIKVRFLDGSEVIKTDVHSKQKILISGKS